jgi:hypothetical protein
MLFVVERRASNNIYRVNTNNTSDGSSFMERKIDTIRHMLNHILYDDNLKVHPDSIPRQKSSSLVLLDECSLRELYGEDYIDNERVYEDKLQCNNNTSSNNNYDVTNEFYDDITYEEKTCHDLKNSQVELPV